MINILSRIFIKNHTDYKNPEVRTAYGILCGAAGIFLNLLLFGVKLAFGLLSSSIAIIADAFNNLSDAASSIVEISGFKLAAMEPDREHPFGHGRIEYISGLIISFFIVLVGIELIKSSFTQIFESSTTPEEINYTNIAILTAAILVKFYMYIYNHKIGKKINSVSLEAVAKDSLGDMISTLTVIASLIVSRFTTLPVDGIAGIIVGLFILKTGYESAKETISPLLGEPPSMELIKEIEEELLTFKPISSMHDIVVHNYGPGRLMISLHAEVPGNENIYDLHEAIDRAEVSISRKFKCHTIIHMDPVDLNNQRLNILKEQTKDILEQINPEMTLHDMRIIPGKKNSNLLFDVVKPFSCKLSNDELIALIRKEVKKLNPDITCVITIDMPYWTTN